MKEIYALKTRTTQLGIFIFHRRKALGLTLVELATQMKMFWTSVIRLEIR